MRYVVLCYTLVFVFTSLYGAPPKEEFKEATPVIVPPQSQPSININRKRLTNEEIQRIKDIQRQIKNLREETVKKVKELSQANDNPETMKIIEKVKFETELKILKLRREIAVIRGNEDLVKEFDVAIDHIEHPEKYRKPALKKTRNIPRRDENNGSFEEKTIPPKE